MYIHREREKENFVFKFFGKRFESLGRTSLLMSSLAGLNNCDHAHKHLDLVGVGKAPAFECQSLELSMEQTLQSLIFA